MCDMIRHGNRANGLATNEVTKRGQGDRENEAVSGMTRRTTSYDVARAAGVSQSTVSRCFQPDGGISKGTREAVFRVAEELGYTRNALARSLITQRSHMIGVIATKFTIRNNPELVFILNAALRDHGLGMLLLIVETDDTVGDILQQALEYPLDGLISCALMAESDIARFVRRGMAVIFFNRDVAAPYVDCIATDHAGSSREVAEAVHAAGHRRILCIGGPEGAPVSRARIDGFTGRMAELGGVEVATVAGNFSYGSGREVFLHAVRDRARPDAVFCANDQLAMGVMDACRFDLGWQVPGDVSVVGFDDVEEAGRPSYDLATVAQSGAAMAERAVEMLLRRIGDPSATAEIESIPGRLVRRGSARLG